MNRKNTIVSCLFLLAGLGAQAQQNASVGSCCEKVDRMETGENFRLTKPVAFSKTITLLPQASLSYQQRITSQKKRPPPKGMVLVPTGLVTIGSTQGSAQEQPTFPVQVKAFFMDEHPVTVAQFRDFIVATGYVTEAEKFGNSAFIDSSSANKWTLKEGANWRFPQGKDYPAAQDHHPVTQVSWNDAQAYCKWAGKRLPNEFEFEYAAKGGMDKKSLYPWGNEMVVNGVYKANVWQGNFPDFNEVADGFKFTSPVGYYGKNDLGLSDMSGNVWQWCANDKFSYDELLEAASKKVFTKPTAKEKAMRGGSFLCEPGWCHGYRVTGRSGSSPETSLMHVGFRCVKDID